MTLLLAPLDSPKRSGETSDGRTTGRRGGWLAEQQRSRRGVKPGVQVAKTGHQGFLGCLKEGTLELSKGITSGNSVLELRIPWFTVEGNPVDQWQPCLHSEMDNPKHVPLPAPPCIAHIFWAVVRAPINTGLDMLGVFGGETL